MADIAVSTDIDAFLRSADNEAARASLGILGPTSVSDLAALYALTGLVGGERYETPEGGIYRYLGGGESLSTSWAVESRPQTSEFIDTLLQQPSKRHVQDLLSVPLPFAAFTHTLTQDEWRKAAKFTYTKTTAPTGTVNVDNGATHVKFLRWDGTFHPTYKAVSGDTIVSAADWGASPTTPYNTKLPKFGAIVPCDSSGVVTGDLTYLRFHGNQLTSFDGTGLGSLTNLVLDHNQLTSFDGTGLGSVTNLDLGFNQLTSFDGTGLGSVTNLGLNENQLTSFVGTGLGSATYLNLGGNQITSFDGTGLGSLTNLVLNENQLTSFVGTGLGSVTNLNLYGNQITSFDGTGLGALAYLSLGSNLLESVLLPEFTGYQPITWFNNSLDFSNQPMTTDAVYLMLDSILSPAVDQPYSINITNCPADDTVTPGPNLVDGDTYTTTQVEALLTAKGYELQVTDGTITG